MTKQEKIRKWMRDTLSGYGCPDSYLDNEINKWLTYLHSQGLAIKVEGELPDCDICHGSGRCTFASTAGYLETYESNCLKCGGIGKDMAGYGLTELLIKEK